MSSAVVQASRLAHSLFAEKADALVCIDRVKILACETSHLAWVPNLSVGDGGYDFWFYLIAKCP